MKNKIYFNWSTGKDSALALYEILQDKRFEVGHLLTSVNAHFDRVSMHGLRRSLLMQQCESIGIPFSTIELPEKPTMPEYDQLMMGTVSKLKAKGFKHAGFGDIFLEDLRKYREEKLSELDIKAHFPLWKSDTFKLPKRFFIEFKRFIVAYLKAIQLFISNKRFCDFVILSVS